MKNRLRMHWRVVLGFCNFFLWLALPGLNAQQGFFSFNYPGPNEIPVKPGTGNCVNKLAGNIGTPVVSSTDGGTITSSMFDPVQSQFQLTDDWNIGEIAHLYWVVTDNHGHSATFEFYVMFTDTTAPVVNPGGLLPLVAYASIKQVPLPPTLTASDSCYVTLNVNFSQTPPPALCQGGTFIRTWTAIDQSGNTGKFTQTIVIHKDTLPPTVTTPPQNGSAACTKAATAYPAWLATQMANFKATDPSGIASYANNAPGTLTGNCPAPVTVTFQATDSCGYTVARTATFTTVDNHGPDVIAAPKDSLTACSPPADNHLAALSDWIHRRAGLLAKDSCTPDAALTYSMQISGVPKDSAQIIAAFLASFANGCTSQQIGNQTYPKVRGVVRVDFFATDACNNATFLGHADFGAIDTVPPLISGIPITEECGGGNDSTNLVSWINNHGNATVIDDCSAFTWTNFTWTTSTGQTGTGQFNNGPYPSVQAHNCNWYVDVTFRATDDCGNTGGKALRFQIKDMTAPVFSGLPPIDTLYCPNTTPPLPTAYVTDNCDNTLSITSNFQTVNQLCSDGYDLLVTWIATDDCGNTQTATQTFMVRDTTSPVFTLVPADITIRCDTFTTPPAPVLGEDVVASDICGDILGLIYEDVSHQDPDPAVCGHYTYTIDRIFTVADDCGNAATSRQTIFVVDDIPPVISGFLDTVAVCATQPMMPPPTASDQCSGIASPPVLLSTDISAGDCPDSYTSTLNWSSTDICGNTGYFSQDIHFEDTIQPSLSGVPGDIFVACNAVPAPPAPGTITGDDNCDEAVDILFSETEIRDPNPANCAHWTNYMVVREWTALDNCGNSRTYTQTIAVQDNTGPEVIAIDTVKMPTAPGVCGANTVVPSLISVFDDCTALQGNITLRDTVVLTPSGMPIDEVPVDTVVFSWVSPNLPPAVPAVGLATLAVALDNADSEQPSETFEIYGEDGYHIGRTKLTNAACGFSGDTTFTVQASLLNAWLSDGQLNIILAPNGQGAAACNAYCAGGRARATLTYSTATQQLPLTVTCTIDNGPSMAYPPVNSFFLDAGDHIITYTATDCAGNSSTARSVVRIEDIEPPSVTAPAGITAYVGAANCLSTVTLPFPVLQENCGFPGNLMLSSLLSPVQFELDPNAGLVPKNTTLSISGALPNAVTSGTLTIRHLGDNGDPGEFFRVLDEQNVFLGATTIASSGACSVAHETNISVSASQINSWAADGLVNIKLQANRNVVNYTDWIGPCGPLDGNNFDGISKVQVLLTYNYAAVQYEIKKDTTTVQSGQLTGNQTAVSAPPGNYTVCYRVYDSSGGQGVATFPLTVRDTIKPVAKCKPITIFTNPTGTINYNLQPQEIDNGSLDNCSGVNLTYQVSQTVFTCNMATTPPNNIYPVTLTVTDTSGNASACTTTVQVRTANCNPTVTPGVCEGATVQLFANPPAPANGYSSYVWSGPNNFVSMAPNPFIPSASSINEGTYTVTVMGQTGCTSVGNVLLDLATLPTQPEFTADVPNLICQGANLTLKCKPYGGNNLMYSWHTGTPGNETLLGTTTITTFIITAPTVGDHQYFVKVSADGCTSVPSDVKTITVRQRPVAIVNTPLISVCPCEPVALGTPVQGSGTISYQWTGPGNFSSTLQNPLVTSCAQEINEGVYSLVVYEDNCPSTPASTNVDVRTKPDKPVISGITSICQGDSIILNCLNVPTAAKYYWISPLSMEIETGINKLVIPNVSPPLHSGNWRLRVLQDNCLSEYSDAKLVQVQAYPNISATSNSPVCQGSPLQLSVNSTDTSVTFQWSGPNNFFAIGPNPMVMNPASGDYIPTVSTGFGCTNTVIVPVTVVTPPYISSVTNTAPLCADCATNAVLQATIFSQNIPLTYMWSGGPNGFQSSLPQPVIPNVCTSDNGTYNLVVKDSVGCVSNQASTEINVQPQPVRPLLSPDQAYCSGTGFSISVLNANAYGGNVSFEWHTPNGILMQSQPKLTIPVSGSQHDGDYWLVVKAGDCSSAPSEMTYVTIHPIPPAPNPTSNSAVCEGSTLRLFADSIPGAQYAWTGPPGSGFTSSIQNPVIAQAAEIHEGCYSVTATVNGCKSPAGVICAEVKSRPMAPVIRPIDPICLDQAGTVLTLKVNPTSGTPMAQYTWYNAQTQDSLGPPSFALTYQLADLSSLSAGANSFYVKATLNGCSTTSLVPATVTLDTIPPGSAYAGVDFDACNAAPIMLNAQKPSIATITGKWSQVGTPALQIIDPFAPDTKVLGGTAGSVYFFAYSLSNGVCKNYSSDTVRVKVNAFEQANAIDVIYSCIEDSITLQATQGQSVAGIWTQPQAQALKTPPVIISDPSDPATIVRNLRGPNKYFFMWTLDVPGCGPSTDTVVVFTYGAKPNAGQDQQLCSNDFCTVLDAKPSLKDFESGEWTPLDAGGTAINFSDPRNTTTSVCNLKIGANRFQWQVNDGICGDRSRDTVVVTFNLEPTANADTVYVPFGEKRTINALLNDVVPPEYSVEVLDAPDFGQWEEITAGTYSYLPDLTFSGTDNLIYELCNIEPACDCKSAQIFFIVGQASDCKIPNIITPNGDGANDIFVVPPHCLTSGDGPSDNEVTIFNQWGDQVFHKENYQNDWDGTYNGEPLPVGTYYYVVKLPGESRPRTGFLLIQR